MKIFVTVEVDLNLEGYPTEEPVDRDDLVDLVGQATEIGLRDCLADPPDFGSDLQNWLKIAKIERVGATALDMNLVSLSFGPQELRDHFDGDEDYDLSGFTDEELNAAARQFICDDAYDDFCEMAVAIVQIAREKKEMAAAPPR